MNKSPNILSWCFAGSLFFSGAFSVLGNCVSAPSGLVGFWPADGNANDLLEGDSGTLSGNASASAEGQVGLAFNFDGTNSSVSIPDSPALRPANLTIEAWVQFDSLTSVVSGPPSGSQYLIFKKNTRGSNFEGYSLEKTAANQFSFVVSSASGDLRKVISSSLISTGAWYHVAGVRGPNFIQLYVNGLSAGQTNVSSPLDYATNSPLYLGTSGQGWDGKLKGKLDEVSLYNRALAPYEISSIYAAGESGKCKAPVIAFQPHGQNVMVGSNVIFEVGVRGVGSINYQWQFNSAPLQGETNSQLSLTSVTTNQDGNYRVVVSNNLGNAISSNARLGVHYQIYATPYTFTTFAGYSSIGSSDGVGDIAQFFQPLGVASDTNDNIFIADRYNGTIRKLTSAGVVSTIAGLAGSFGSADGTNSEARFYNPFGITVDNAGNLYVADEYNSTVRKITPVGTNWVVTTFAGRAGIKGSTDGTGTNALFIGPQNITTDSDGNVYVADFNIYDIYAADCRLRMITPAGVVTTLPISVGYKTGIAAGTNGIIYLTSGGGIHMATASGNNWTVSTIAGSGIGSADGTNSEAQFYYPSGIAVDSAGNLYVADTGNNTIRKVTQIGTDWVVSTLAGQIGNPGSADGTGTNASFNLPVGVALDRVGNVYVADSDNSLIRKVTSAGIVRTWAGARGSYADGVGKAAKFNSPSGVTVDSAGHLYVTDTGNCTIRQITPAGLVTTFVGSPGIQGSADGIGVNAQFNNPTGIAVDTAGNLYVADTFNHTIRKVSPGGVVTTIAGLAGNLGNVDGTNSDARFEYPRGIEADSAGNVFVLSGIFYSFIRKITPIGTNWGVTTINNLHSLYSSHGLAIDNAGNLIVADSGNFRIAKASPEGVNWVISDFAGIGYPAVRGVGDGVATNALFSEPQDVAVDTDGNVFVTETYNNELIRKVSLEGVVTTIAGLYSTIGSADGAGSAARFNRPSGIAVDNGGNLYVADRGNNTIRKGVFTQYGAASPMPYTQPPMNGQLTVTLLPFAAGGQWRFPWEFSWRYSGVTASNLVAGNYPIEFRNVPGYLALPIPPVQVTSGNMTSITNQYLPTISAADSNSTPGSLTVFLGPTPPSGAGWRFLGENGPYFSTGFTTNLLPGTYLIEFAAVTNRVKPPSQTVQINPGLPSYLSVNYLLAATPPSGVYLPFPVPTNQVNDETIYPFGFNGQLQSDKGYGSGVAVQPNVVLTAAHLVFNDQTLSYVSRAHWFFRRDAGVGEPLPQAARGFYVLSGYASQRTNDLQSGYSPDQSTPPSRNADVAALYFLQPVAGGGHGGYLPSDAVPNTWLTSTALKMLVGYPVDGSQFGTVISAGRMYQTDPQPYPLSIAVDPVPGQQQVYQAPWFLSYPGNSGGPLYVQLNGYYYPAAVYLGTLFSGSQPYASVVRAIDSNVVNLITLAATQGDSGTNNTGGGVITIIPSQAISSSNPGFVQFPIFPPAAVLAGAGWRLHGDANYSGFPNYTRAVKSTNAFAEFKPIAGWNLPTNQTITVIPGQIAASPAFYTVTNPVMVANKTVGIGITGTTGTVYRIESRSSLTSGTWLPLSTNTIMTNGFNLVLPLPATNQPASFYRAVWLPQ